MPNDIFVCFLLIIAVSSVFNSEDCRIVNWRFPAEHKALQGHVIATVSVQTGSACETACHQEPNCVSCNFNRENLTCELSNSSDQTHPDSVVDAPGWTYNAFENDCIGRSCPPGTVCQVGYGGLGEYRCKGQFIAHFPATLHVYALKFHPLPLINVFSVSVWFKTNLVSGSNHQTIVSIVAKDYPKIDAFNIDLRGNGIRIESNGKNRLISSGELRDGNWHHMVFTWSAANGDWELYLNGTLSDSESGFSTGFSMASGYLVAGHEQDSYGGGFEKNQGFYGSMVGLNLWSRVLSKSEITHLAKSWCAPLEGDLVKWRQFYPSDVSSLGGIQIKAQRCE
ncbi:sushi, von Willebrand factor type A, EGF and pentraxin domain-containing protein 1 isoform X1 [Nematostella vectensis]|uniref:sushi, von Willebrand factor type A, EGF and pentraxin domain-containing protein 1 isoform X1 n=1 Tax=Nematostella vectensis TaxID=45351 RepID=UPI002076D72B|nr:sushi, von Willebrand factor type A, EGF and pentraxin domain-containing protein 1 isoform X1 [Nematostella vectensis]